MSHRLLADQRSQPALGPGSRYARVWMTAARVAAVVWIAIAVFQTPRLPLVSLAVGVGAVGGLAFLRAPASTATGRRQYASGALTVAGLVLVWVGIGHHMEAGLTVAVLLAATSPPVIRWISGG
jgi:hypothetical protein